MKMNFFFLMLLFIPFCRLSSQTGEKPLSVGIFVYPGVEILDFSGPSEVFASTNGFEPFVVAYKKEPIISQGFVTITPQYSIEDCPPTDILVFPGGGTGNVMNKPEFIRWLQDRAQNTQILMSVCTGAGLLSKAGLLDGKEATTFHDYLQELQKMTPKATILPETRFVDNGQIITTAGVSAGIDGALHVVAKIKGLDVAKATAFYMEYDKWQPNAGKVNETPFIQDVRKLGLAEALKQHQNPKGPGPLYYPSELLTLSEHLRATQPAESEAILRHLMQTGQAEPSVCDALGEIMAKNGKSIPPTSQAFRQKLEAGELEWAKKTYSKVAEKEPHWLLFTEEDLNATAYTMLNNNKGEFARDLFVWISELFPESPNAWDSLAEYYEATGNASQAIACSEKCLAKLARSPYDEHRKKMYEDLNNKRLQRLKSK